MPKELPDINCLKIASSTQKTSVEAVQRTQVIITESNKITNVMINYKPRELEMKLHRGQKLTYELYYHRQTVEQKYALSR